MIKRTQLRVSKGRHAPHETVRIYTDGTARIHFALITSEFYVPDFNTKSKKIFLRLHQKGRKGFVLQVWKSNARAKSPIISLVSTLEQMGEKLTSVAGMYRATVDKSGTITIALKKKLGLCFKR